jgi:aryl-alcohol dehydrogenase-like predicted oxidoreductase
MNYKTLGRSGLKVSELCLGAMTFGEEFGIGAGEAECRRIFDRFVEAGGNFVDTADMYNRGTSERMLGNFIRADREFVVLASKYSLNTRADDPNAGGSHRKNLVQSLDASLSRLQTDRIDLYWVHGWDGKTRLDELMRALDDQVRAGKILHIGYSNAPTWVIAQANTLAEERGWTPFSALQLNYSLVVRSIEREYLELARAHDMAITAWSPLAGGLLTAKFNPGADKKAQEGARLVASQFGSNSLTEDRLEVAQGLAEIAAARGCTSAQLALAWIMRRVTEPTMIPIIGARNLKQLEDNLGATDVEPDAQTIARLDALAPVTPEYPQTLFASEFFQTMLYGEVRARMSP